MPDACSAVMCLSCGGYYCNCCLAICTDSASAHQHVATHSPERISSVSGQPVRNDAELANAFLPENVVLEGQKQFIWQKVQEVLSSSIQVASNPDSSSSDSAISSQLAAIEIALFLERSRFLKEYQFDICTLVQTPLKKSELLSKPMPSTQICSQSSSLEDQVIKMRREEARQNAVFLRRGLLSSNHSALSAVVATLWTRMSACFLEHSQQVPNSGEFFADGFENILDLDSELGQGANSQCENNPYTTLLMLAIMLLPIPEDPEEEEEEEEVTKLEVGDRVPESLDDCLDICRRVCRVGTESASMLALRLTMLLLLSGHDPLFFFGSTDHPPQSGRSALYIAVERGQLPFLRLLVCLSQLLENLYNVHRDHPINGIWSRKNLHIYKDGIPVRLPLCEVKIDDMYAFCSALCVAVIWQQSEIAAFLLCQHFVHKFNEISKGNSEQMRIEDANEEKLSNIRGSDDQLCQWWNVHAGEESALGITPLQQAAYSQNNYICSLLLALDCCPFYIPMASHFTEKAARRGLDCVCPCNTMVGHNTKVVNVNENNENHSYRWKSAAALAVERGDVCLLTAMLAHFSAHAANVQQVKECQRLGNNSCCALRIVAAASLSRSLLHIACVYAVPSSQRLLLPLLLSQPCFQHGYHSDESKTVVKRQEKWYCNRYNIADQENYTPLNIAIALQNESAVKCLLRDTLVQQGSLRTSVARNVYLSRWSLINIAQLGLGKVFQHLYFRSKVVEERGNDAIVVDQRDEIPGDRDSIRKLLGNPCCCSDNPVETAPITKGDRSWMTQHPLFIATSHQQWRCVAALLDMGSVRHMLRRRTHVSQYLQLLWLASGCDDANSSNRARRVSLSSVKRWFPLVCPLMGIEMSMSAGEMRCMVEQSIFGASSFMGGDSESDPTNPTNLEEEPEEYRKLMFWREEALVRLLHCDLVLLPQSSVSTSGSGSADVVEDEEGNFSRFVCDSMQQQLIVTSQSNPNATSVENAIPTGLRHQWLRRDSGVLSVFLSHLLRHTQYEHSLCRTFEMICVALKWSRHQLAIETVLPPSNLLSHLLLRHRQNTLVSDSQHGSPSTSINSITFGSAAMSSGMQSQFLLSRSLISAVMVYDLVSAFTFLLQSDSVSIWSIAELQEAVELAQLLDAKRCLTILNLQLQLQSDSR